MSGTGAMGGDPWTGAITMTSGVVGDPAEHLTNSLKDALTAIRDGAYGNSWRRSVFDDASTLRDTFRVNIEGALGDLWPMFVHTMKSEGWWEKWVNGEDREGPPVVFCLSLPLCRKVLAQLPEGSGVVEDFQQLMEALVGTRIQAEGGEGVVQAVDNEATREKAAASLAAGLSGEVVT